MGTGIPQVRIASRPAGACGASCGPVAPSVFHTTALSARDWGLAIAVASTILLLDEAFKLVMMMRLRLRLRLLHGRRFETRPSS